MSDDLQVPGLIVDEVRRIVFPDWNFRSKTERVRGFAEVFLEREASCLALSLGAVGHGSPESVPAAH